MRPLLFVLLTLAALAACGDDGGGDADAGDAIDAAVCVLDPEPVDCTEGDDGPCQALCATAYCHYYGMIERSVCTSNCFDPGDCPGGWDCNDMGRCRPPG